LQGTDYHRVRVLLKIRGQLLLEPCDLAGHLAGHRSQRRDGGAHRGDHWRGLQLRGPQRRLDLRGPVGQASGPAAAPT
jgi:hypothetical protein